MDRNVIIDRLVDATLVAALQDPELAWLRAMLRQGFRGFAHLHDSALIRELELRGLLDPPDAAFDDDVDDAPIEDEIASRG